MTVPASLVYADRWMGMVNADLAWARERLASGDVEMAMRAMRPVPFELRVVLDAIDKAYPSSTKSVQPKRDSLEAAPYMGRPR